MTIDRLPTSLRAPLATPDLNPASTSPGTPSTTPGAGVLSPSLRAAAMDGLSNRASSSTGNLPPRLSLSTLPADALRNIGEQLNAKSMVAFAATSQSMQAAMQDSKVHEQVTKTFRQMNAAGSAADFKAGLEALKDIQSSTLRGEALSSLTERFVLAHAELPIMEALSVRSALMDALTSMPAQPGSAEALAPGVIAAFDLIQTMTHQAGRFTRDQAVMEAVPQADRDQILLETGATMEAVLPDQLALNTVLNKHGMAALREPMIQLIDKFFDAHSTPPTVKFALIVIPVRLSTLEPGTVSQNHVTELLNRLAQHAIGPAGLRTMGEEDRQSYGDLASVKMRAALEAHDIDPAMHPALNFAR